MFSEARAAFPYDHRVELGGARPALRRLESAIEHGCDRTSRDAEGVRFIESAGVEKQLERFLGSQTNRPLNLARVRTAAIAYAFCGTPHRANLQ